MVTDRSLTHIDMRYPMFVDQIEPKGRLLINKECHACFYYLITAQKNARDTGESIEDQIIVTEDGLREPDWMERRYDQIARSIATLYQLESPEQFLVFIPQALEECKRQGIAVPADVFSPLGVGRIQ